MKFFSNNIAIHSSKKTTEPTILFGGEPNQKLTLVEEILYILANQEKVFRFQNLSYEMMIEISKLVLDLSDSEYQKLINYLPFLDNDSLEILMGTTSFEKEIFDEFILTDRIKIFGKAAVQMYFHKMDDFYDVIQEMYCYVEIKYLEPELINVEFENEIKTIGLIPIFFTETDKAQFIQEYKDLLRLDKSRNS